MKQNTIKNHTNPSTLMEALENTVRTEEVQQDPMNEHPSIKQINAPLVASVESALEKPMPEKCKSCRSLAMCVMSMIAGRQ